MHFYMYEKDKKTKERKIEEKWKWKKEKGGKRNLMSMENKEKDYKISPIQS